MSKRTKTLGLHEWSKEDNILAFYYTKYGTYGLYLKDENSLAKWIGSSLGSLKMQSANFRGLMGESERALSDYSKLQAEVYNEYGNMSKMELMKVAKRIIDQDTYERNEILKKIGDSKTKKQVVQKNKDNEIIKIYSSVWEIRTTTKYKNVSKVLNGSMKHCGGYKWEYYYGD